MRAHEKYKSYIKETSFELAVMVGDEDSDFFSKNTVGLLRLGIH